jgi:hypothetical protein
MDLSALDQHPAGVHSQPGRISFYDEVGNSCRGESDLLEKELVKIDTVYSLCRKRLIHLCQQLLLQILF